MIGIETERLLLRQWRKGDRPLYAAFNADPETRRFYVSTLSAEESDANVGRFAKGLDEHGYGFFAVERKRDGAFIGDVGFVPVAFALRGSPPVEMGWLIGRPYWGHGYAPEAARACLDLAFGRMNLPEVVAFATRANRPSRRVMEKIGMTRDPEGDFEHPEMPAGHPLRPHVLYRIANPAFRR